MQPASTATAFWVDRPGHAVLRPHELSVPGPDEVLVRTLFSGISRGTESLVFTGQVPLEQAIRMRAPFQVGDLPGPVSHGYLAVGTVEQGPAHLLGRDVFVLHPHHDRFVVPAAAAHPLPDTVPARRAVLAGTVETAVNVLWDAGVRLGDRVAVVGAGTVGACVARLAAGVPGVVVDLVDPQPQRALLAAALHVRYRHPDDLAGAADVGSYDIVVHTSATEDGLGLALRLAPDDGEVLEVSWFGSRLPAVPLGADVHTRRVGIRPSQVSRVAPARRERRSPDDRLALSLRLLGDPAFEHVLGEDVAFEDLPERAEELLGWTRRADATCAVVRYSV